MLLHVLHYGVEEICGLLSDFIQRPIGTELGRGVEGPLQLVEMLPLIEGGDRYDVLLGCHTGEIGLDADGLERGHDEERRGLEVDLVPEELVQGIVKV